MSKPDFVTCERCRTTLRRNKARVLFDGTTWCENEEACRVRAFHFHNFVRAESARDEADRWNEQFNPRRRTP